MHLRSEGPMLNLEFNLIGKRFSRGKISNSNRNPKCEMHGFKLSQRRGGAANDDILKKIIERV